MKKKKTNQKAKDKPPQRFFSENKLLHSPSMWQSRIKQRMAVWKWHYHMNVTFFLFPGNWIGKYSCWINTVSFWWDKAHSIATKENTGEVKEASYRCTEMKPKPEAVHMVNKLTLRLWPLWRGCPKPLLTSRNSVLYCWLILLIFSLWDLWKFSIWYNRKRKTLKQFSIKGHRAMSTTLRGAWWINYHRRAQWAWLTGS